MRTSSGMRLPLTSAQTGIWLAQRFAPGVDYSIALYLDINGPLDPALLLQAAREVFDETDAFRARVVETGGDPIQVISDGSTFAMPYVDFSDRLDAREAATAWMSDDLTRPLVLESGRNYSFALFKVSDERHLWYLRCHHVAFDGFSGALYLRRTAFLYTSLVKGAGCDRDSFGALQDLVLDDSSYRESKSFRADREYWAKKLAGCPAPASLGQVNSSRAAGCTRVTSYFEHSRISALEILAKTSGVRLPAVFVAAQFLHVARMTGETDVILGLPVTARFGKSMRNIPGMVSNIIPLRLMVDPKLELSEFLCNISVEMRIALRHQRYRYENLRRDLKLSEGGQPLVGPHVNLQIFDYDLHFGHSIASSHNVTNGPVEDLSLVVYSGTNHVPWRIDLDANSERYSCADLAVHQRCILQLIDGMTASRANKPIGRIDIFDADQRQQLLVGWNDTQREIPLTTVPELFEAQVARTPEKTAVVCQRESLSYAQLNDRANQLARLLLERGIGPELIVALAVPRSLEMIVALLAILKSGAGYLPIDSDHPADRIDFMLADARPALLITTSSTARHLPEARGVPRLLLDDSAVSQTLSELPSCAIDDTDRAQRLTPANPIYVIYTSGSTGRPKGVVNTHAGVSNRLLWMQDRYGLGHTDRVLQKTSCGFDVSVWEFFWPLITGAVLLVAEPEKHKDPAYIAAIIQDRQITTVHFVPSMLKVFLSEQTVGKCHSLRRVICSGEALPAELADRFFDVFGCELHNLYGPTEASIDVTSWKCEPASEGGLAPPIGRPISNTLIFVLNKALQPVPVGVAGELYLAGVGLARGYLNRPDLTAQRFVSCPLGEPGSRMYRTGDLARWDENGAQCYLGRDDDQVKIRGARVELGEIAAMLGMHHEVAEARVIAREDGQGPRADGQGQRGTSLVGYVVPDWKSLSARLEQARHAHVGEWEQLYQTMYATPTAADFGQDFAGWNSSYNGRPIPLGEMMEWQAATVQRIRSLCPARILEIGVGSGLILSRLAVGCESYWGTDLSAAAIGKLRRQLDERPEFAGRIELRAQPADDFDGLPAEFFDTVIINSVVQYFPSAEYLNAVLYGALELVKSGGRVFIGDVRNLRLKRSLDTAVVLENLGSNTDTASVRRVVDQKALQENELLVDPEFFGAMGGAGNGTIGVDIRVKRGQYDNELSRYRYDVVLHKQSAQAAVSLADATWVLWRSEVDGLRELGSRLESGRPARLRVVGVPNGRMVHEAMAARALVAGRLLADVRREFDQAKSVGVAPDAFHELGEQLGYQVVVTWSSIGTDGELDVLFLEVAGCEPAVLTDVYLTAGRGKIPLNAHTNNPGLAREAARLTTTLRDYLRQRLPDYMVPTALVVLDSLPVTTNGKLDRRALPAPDLSTNPAARPPSTPHEYLLCELFAQVLGVPRIGVDDSFFDYGGDSIGSIQLVSRARRRGVVFTPRDVFRCKTVARLVGVVGISSGVVVEASDAGVGVVSLTPIVHHLRGLGGPIGRFNQSVFVQVPVGVCEETLVAAVQVVLDHHDALRMRLVRVGAEGEWVLQVGARGAVGARDCVRRMDVAAVGGDEFRVAVHDAARSAWGRLDPDAGVMVQVVWYDAGRARPGYLLWAAHHLVVDGVSWRILLPDLAEAYTSLAGGREPALEPVGTSLWQWSQHLGVMAHNAERVGELPLWSAIVDGPDPLLSRRRLDRAVDVVSTRRTLSMTLPGADTAALLTSVVAAFHATVNDVLLTAMVLAVQDWWRRQGNATAPVLLDVEGHGREEVIEGVDLSRTVGWFTSLFPVRLDPGVTDWNEVWAGGPAIGAALKVVKEQLNALPDNGLGYGLLRYLNSDTAGTLADKTAPQIGFNYLGRFTMPTQSQDWNLAPDLDGFTGAADPDMPLAHALDINALVQDNTDGPHLIAHWSWPQDLFPEHDIHHLAHTWFTALQALVTHTQHPNAGGHTPSDLPLVTLSQDEIEIFQEQLSAEWGM